MVAAEILRLDADEQRAVRVLRVAPVLAHAVDDYSALFARRVDHRAAGAHTKCISSAPVLRVAGELIVRRAERGMPCEVAVLRAVDELARMLYSRAYRKRLLHHFDPVGIERSHGVARRMSGAEQDGIGLDILKMPVVLGLHAVDIAVRDYYIRHFAVESDFTAERDYLFSDIADNLGKAVGADMRLCRPAYLLGRAVVSKLVYNKAAERVFYARCELAVRKSSCAALAELNVRFGIESALAPEGLNIFLPVFDMRTAFENERLEARPGESKPRKHACGAESDYNRAQFARALYLRGGKVNFLYRFNTRAATLENRVLVAVNINFYIIHKENVVLFARIDRFFRHSQCAYSVFVKAKSFTGRAPEIVFVRSQRKLYLIYFKHTFSPLNRFCRTLSCEQT